MAGINENSPRGTHYGVENMVASRKAAATPQTAQQIADQNAQRNNIQGAASQYYTPSVETAMWAKIFPGASQAQITQALRAMPTAQSTQLSAMVMKAGNDQLNPDSLREKIAGAVALRGSPAAMF